MGGMALHDGRLAEMATGEGKTLVAVLPVYLNALSGKHNNLFFLCRCVYTHMKTHVYQCVLLHFTFLNLLYFALLSAPSQILIYFIVC